ncbi:MAG: E3 binding domain-containing protein, partial [Tetrasphaera sp.]|nr:E3 binding domain-containing protein [Tetrasphaera sp.]
MTTREFKLPDPGEGLLEAEIVEWKVAVGDPVKVNDIVVEVETAKSLVELPIPWAGTVTGIHVAVGDEVEVGTVIITIDDGAEGAAPADSTPAAESPAPDAVADGADEEPVKTLVGYGPKASGTTRRARRTPAAPTATAAPAAPAAIATPPAPTPVGGADAEAGEAPRPSAAETRALAKPPVRKLAKDLGIDLGAVPPTGERGIVTRADVESYAAGRANPSAASVVAP